MYAAGALLFLAASGASASAIVQRDIQVGWALQASSAPSGTSSCSDSGFYCPSSLTCVKAASHEAPACCSSASECRGTIEGSPKCADSTWSLFTGNSGNGFCCQSGEVGTVDYSGTSVGTCTGSPASDATTASEASTAAATSTASSASSASSASASSSSAASSSSTASESSATSSASGSASSAASSASKSASSASKSASSTASAAASSASASGSAAAASATGAAGNVVASMFGLSMSGLLMAAAL